MYTSDSKYFSPTFKAKAIAVIQAERQNLTDADFATASYSQTNGGVKEHGSRWKDDEQVFQNLVMVIDDLHDKTGSGWLRHVDAMSWEVELLASADKFRDVTKKALVSAIGTDYYYLYEKQYN